MVTGDPCKHLLLLLLLSSSEPPCSQAELKAALEAAEQRALASEGAAQELKGRISMLENSLGMKAQGLKEAEGRYERLEQLNGTLKVRRGKGGRWRVDG